MAVQAPAKHSPQLTALRREILQDFIPEMNLACKLAVLVSAGYRGKPELMRQLGCTSPEYAAALERLKRVATERLDNGD